MANLIELEAIDLAAMLCSRVCHDLINPIGAIGNGLEMLADPSQAEMAEPSRKLIASGAHQARAKLEFARLAYGASSTAGTSLDTRECERVARLLFEVEKAELDWRAPLILLPKNKGKLFMNMLLISANAVPRGGKVIAEITGMEGEETFRFTATSDASLRQRTLMPANVAPLISGSPPEGVDARGIQPFYTGLLARLSDMHLEIGIENEVFTFSATPSTAVQADAAPLEEAGEPAGSEPFAANDQKSA